jgi:hypothetical protein
MSTPSTPPPPGWYPDPEDPTGRSQRYFDGSAWTPHRAPAATAAPAPAPGPPPRTASTGRTLALVAAAVLAPALLVVGLAIVGVVIGASQDTGTDEPAPTAVPGTTASGRRYPADPLAVDPCALLSGAELRSVARQDLGEPERLDPAPGEANPVKRCRYESEDRIEVSISRYFFTDTEPEFAAFYAPGRPDPQGEPTRYPVEPIDGLPTGSARDPQDFLNLDVTVLTPGGWSLDVHIARHDLPPDGALVGELRRLTALALDRYAPR